MFSAEPIRVVFSNLVALRVAAQLVKRATKIKICCQSRTKFYFVQHIAATCNTEVCCATSCGGGNTGNNALQLAKQQCCATSCKEMLPILLDLNEKQPSYPSLILTHVASFAALFRDVLVSFAVQFKLFSASCVLDNPITVWSFIFAFLILMYGNKNNEHGNYDVKFYL